MQRVAFMLRFIVRCCGCLGLLLFPIALLHAAQLTREAVLEETLMPYTGPSAKGVDTSTLSNKVMCGYQGWFNVEGDGAERGWVHLDKTPRTACAGKREDRSLAGRFGAW